MKGSDTKRRIEYLVDGITEFAMGGLLAACAVQTRGSYAESYFLSFMLLAVGTAVLGCFSLRRYFRYNPGDGETEVKRTDYAISAVLDLVCGTIWVTYGLLKLTRLVDADGEEFLELAILVVGLDWLIKAAVQGWCWLNYDKHVLK